MAERALAREVVHRWNDLHSQATGLVLQPVGWETHSVPIVGSHPQKILNEQILERCDLLIAMFWTRLGTPTEHYASGSVEEIERHVAAGKPAMLYFNNAPVHLASINAEEFARLMEFKGSLQSRSLYASYEGATEFGSKLFDHLQMTVNGHSLFREALAGRVATEIAPGIKLPALSDAAKSLLLDVSLDPSGTLLLVHYLSGTSLTVNRKELITEQSRRVVAQWESALKELVIAEMLEPRGDKGELFAITERGYQLAEMLPG